MLGKWKFNRRIRTIISSWILCFTISMVLPMQTKAEIIDKYTWNDFIYNTQDGIQIENYTGNAETLTIPSEINGEKVKGVLSLSKANNLKKLIVPDGIQFYHAVASCKTLKKIQISKTNSLYKVKNNLLLSKDGKILRGCPGGIKSPKIPDSVTVIGYFAFRNSDITKVTLGKHVKYIGNYAFSGCKKLKEIKWNKKVNRIGDMAFYGCAKLKQITISKKVKKIGMSAFPEKTTIYGKKGSAAEKYAKKNKLKFIQS